MIVQPHRPRTQAEENEVRSMALQLIGRPKNVPWQRDWLNYGIDTTPYTLNEAIWEAAKLFGKTQATPFMTSDNDRFIGPGRSLGGRCDSHCVCGKNG